MDGEMGDACRTRERGERFMQNLIGKHDGKIHILRR